MRAILRTIGLLTLLLSVVLMGCGSGSGVTISLSPTATTLSTGGTQTFMASVGNANNPSVTWSVQEGSSGGTITSAGVYTAPSTAGTYHVIATSVADNSKTAIATITTLAGGSSVTVN